MPKIVVAGQRSCWRQRGGHERVVRALLEAPGIDVSAIVNDRNKNGRTALMLAADGGHETIVRALLEARSGVNVNAIIKTRDSDGRTALMLAALKDTMELYEHYSKLALVLIIMQSSMTEIMMA